MTNKTIQDILPLVERPSRYLGSEINRIKKDLSCVKLFFALAFPDQYEIGMSHFGLQILYHILNRRNEIAAERVFAPGIDMENYLRSNSIPLISLESNRPLAGFDIIGFSLLYELNYTNVLNMLNLAKIPFMSSERDNSFPIIIAGGPCTCNPEPVADFFDAIVVGDGEDVIIELSDIWLNWNQNCKKNKKELLKMWSKIEGVYIPAFFDPVFSKAFPYEFQTLLPRFSNYLKVKRRIFQDLDKAPFPETPILPYGKPVHDRLRIELARGCTRGCRFCQAGMIYRPVRERSPKTVLALIDSSIASTGYEDISLLSLSTGDYSCIVPLMEQLMTDSESSHIAVSFPSLRAGTLTTKLMELIKKTRKTGFTIAPEAGSQRLRNVINKNITEKMIIDTVENVFNLGWRVIKLYFMIGLPSETDDDLQAIVDLVKLLRKVKGHKVKINVSVTTFIPKPHTPFQWVSQISLDKSRKKILWLKDKLKMPGIGFKWQNPEVSLIEGLFARGDRRLSSLLVSAFKKGCKFDGWSDNFNYQLWKEALFDSGLEINSYTTRRRDPAEPLPWDHIDIKVSKTYLKQEFGKALKGELTPDCRNIFCNSCGVCDFKMIKPKIFESFQEELKPPMRLNRIAKPGYKKLKISYSKQREAKYFGHLELMNIFLRALRRSKISLKYSEGFHPMPKISFKDSLPIGISSLDESFYLTVDINVKPQTVIKNLNNCLPEGLFIHGCNVVSAKSSEKKSDIAIYRVRLKDKYFKKEVLQNFIKSSELILTRTNRKGKQKKINLKEIVLKIDLAASDILQMELKSEPGKTVRPFYVIRSIFNLPDEAIRLADIVKIKQTDGVST